MASLTWWTWAWTSSRSGQGRYREAWLAAVHWVQRVHRTGLLNWTEPGPLPHKITGLVRRFLLRRRNTSLSKIHCCSIIICTELKEKYTLEQDELFCCIIISSGLKENKLMWLRQSNVEKKHLPFSLRGPDPFPLPSSGTLDFLSTYLRINSHYHMDHSSLLPLLI